MPNKLLYIICSLRYGVNIYLSKLNRLISTCLMKMYFISYGVVLKGNQSFFGKTYLRRHPSGKITIGKSCVFRSSFSSNSIGLKQKCFLSVGKNAELSIGNHCGLSGTVINSAESIKLGDRVFCGANVTISDNDRHPVESEPRFLNKKGKSAPVYIGNDVWLGMNVVVMKGVCIGDGAVVAANSVVVKDIPNHVVAGGAPATTLRKLL